MRNRRPPKNTRKPMWLYSVVILLLIAAGWYITSRLPDMADILPNKVVLPEGSYLRVDYVDVGQADFIIIECDGEYMTIDGGNVEDRPLVAAYLKERDIKEIGTVVISHPHEDHCGAVPAILSQAQVETVYCSMTEYDTPAFDDVLSYVEGRGMEITVPVVGETFTLGSAQVQVLGPVKSYENINNTSIVLKVIYGETSFLFTGDAECSSETDILNAGFDISADVLKVGHHGSSTSTSYIWLMAADPVYAVISSNRRHEPDYNHPHAEVVSRLRDFGAVTYRTDLQGTITCISDGKDITFTVEENSDINVFYDAGDGQYNRK